MVILERILISLLAGVAGLYCLFCLFLTCVTLPSEPRDTRYYFEKEPKGFVKFSRIFGLILMWVFVLTIIVGIMYTILFV